mgnify:CR=1 FL=1
MVSIITPAYKSESIIGETIESVLNQTFPDWEMIIVDDNSQDNTKKVVESYNDKRIRLITLEKNVGAANARNIALQNAQGRFIAFLDSDDIWYPEKLDIQLKFMKELNIAFSFTSYEAFNSETKETLYVVNVPSEINYKSYLKNTIIGCLTVMIDREKTGSFYMPDIKSSHDMALWLNILKRGFNAYGIDKVLAKYRVSNNSVTSNKFKAMNDVWHVYRDIEKLSFCYSLYCFTNYIFNASKKRFNK